MNARGLTTSPIPLPAGIFEIEFDFLQHRLLISTSDGRERYVPLFPRSVADFYAEYMESLKSVGIALSIDTRPQEFPDPIPFDKDDTHASYDSDAVERFWRILVNLDTLFKQYRSDFIGKSSPVHFFWGSFDLALTRFCGQARPGTKRRRCRHPRGLLARSHQLRILARRTDFPARGSVRLRRSHSGRSRETAVRPSAAFYSQEMGEFFLKYDDVRARAIARAGRARLLPEHLRRGGDAGAVGPRGARKATAKWRTA